MRKRITYNKLIRDRIPEIIETAGKKYAVEVMDQTDFRIALLEKLIEEAQEISEAGEDKIEAEVADLLEVVDAVIQTYGLSKAAVLALQEARRASRGGFEKRLKLLWSEAD